MAEPSPKEIFDELIRVLRGLQSVPGRQYDYVDMLSLFYTHGKGNLADEEFFTHAQDIIYDHRDLLGKIIQQFRKVDAEFAEFQKTSRLQMDQRTWEARKRIVWVKPNQPWDWRYFRDNGCWAPEGILAPWIRRSSDDSELTDDDRQTTYTGSTSTDASLASTSSDKSCPIDINLEDKLPMADEIPDIPKDLSPDENPESPSKRARLERDEPPKDPEAPSE